MFAVTSVVRQRLFSDVNHMKSFRLTFNQLLYITECYWEKQNNTVPCTKEMKKISGSLWNPTESQRESFVRLFSPRVSFRSDSRLKWYLTLIPYDSLIPITLGRYYQYWVSFFQKGTHEERYRVFILCLVVLVFCVGLIKHSKLSENSLFQPE